ncbi:hypothetical protein GGX14DRAFT_558649 [Mycena pura]|uniref:Uncharacterized protein n=1 Tax=Mycena pura TaxID=153505 RepID=A0AAD6YL78_9AGAR|nr:hypothetical protein GGX14DRAFT_558649 [Mycena pura]
MASSCPSRTSSPDFGDEDEYSNLMSTVTPISSPARKLALRPNGNHLQVIGAYATRKRLRPEQVAEVESFFSDPFPVQMAKLFVNVKANENALAKFQAAKPKFEINSDLKTNLTRATNATLCSIQITQYRGEAAKNDVQTLLTRHRWGNFVAGTEHDKAAMDVIQKFIGDVLTQSRSAIKKEIVKSVETAKQKKSQDPPSLRPDHTHTTIYQLTKTIVQKLSGGKAISIPITPALCARVAMMRKWHVRRIENKLSPEDAGKSLWELVDQDLQIIRTVARKDTEDSAEIAKRVAKAFAAILDKDRKRHGSNPTEEIPDTIDDALVSYQADIDGTIEARSHGQTVSTGEGTEEQQCEGST